MYRNGRYIPFLALCCAAALFFAAYLDGRQMEQRTGVEPEELSVGQIGMMAFAALFLVYGAIGFISAWLEGTELRPMKRKKNPGRIPFLAGVLLAALLAALAGSFARLIYKELATGVVTPSLEGTVAAGIFLVAALLLLLYRKSFIEDEVLVEDERGEVPW